MVTLTFVFKILVTLTLAIIVAIALNMMEDHKQDVMSFRESLDLADLPVITFTQGVQKLNFLFDTGANISVIDKSIIAKLEVKETDRVSRMSGIGGSIDDVRIVDISFQYKDKTFEDGFQVVDMSSTFTAIKQSTGVTVHGMIGNNFMQKYRYVLDFDEMIAYSKGKR